MNKTRFFFLFSLTVFLLLLGRLPNAQAGWGKFLPDKFDVKVTKQDTWITKNGFVWDYEKELGSEATNTMNSYWYKPWIFSFRNGQVVSRHEWVWNQPYSDGSGGIKFILKENLSGTFQKNIFRGKSISYSESYLYRSDMPSGLYAKSWSYRSLTGTMEEDGVLVLKSSETRDESYYRPTKSVTDSNGNTSWQLGNWQRTPKYNSTDVYDFYMKLQLPLGEKKWNQELYKQPDVAIDDPSVMASSGVVDNPTPSGEQPPPDNNNDKAPANEAGKQKESSQGFIAGGAAGGVGEQENNPFYVPGESSQSSPSQEEQMQQEGKAAGAAAAAGATAAAGALLMLGASGTGIKETFEDVQNLTGKKLPFTEPTDVELDPLSAWEKKYTDLGWKYDDDAGGYVPQSGAVSEDGRVWMKSPYENGESQWMDKAEAAQIRDRQARGEVWDDTYGWKTREDLQENLDRNTYERSAEYRDAEHKGLMDQVHKDIEWNRAHDPEYQARQQELQELQEERKECIRDRISFNQENAEWQTQRAERYDRLYERASVVKSVADKAVNLGCDVIPGGRPFKYAYNATTKGLETYIETGGDVSKTVVAVGKQSLTDVIGDKIGDKIPLGNQDVPGDLGKYTMTELLETTGEKEVVHLTTNYFKSQEIGNTVKEGVDQVTDMAEDGIESVTDNYVEPTLERGYSGSSNTTDIPDVSNDFSSDNSSGDKQDS